MTCARSLQPFNKVHLQPHYAVLCYALRLTDFIFFALSTHAYACLWRPIHSSFVFYVTLFVYVDTMNFFFTSTRHLTFIYSYYYISFSQHFPNLSIPSASPFLDFYFVITLYLDYLFTSPLRWGKVFSTYGICKTKIWHGINSIPSGNNSFITLLLLLLLLLVYSLSISLYFYFHFSFPSSSSFSFSLSQSLSISSLPNSTYFCYSHSHFFILSISSSWSFSFSFKSSFFVSCFYSFCLTTSLSSLHYTTALYCTVL